MRSVFNYSHCVNNVNKFQFYIFYSEYITCKQMQCEEMPYDWAQYQVSPINSGLINLNLTAGIYNSGWGYESYI